MWTARHVSGVSTQPPADFTSNPSPFIFPRLPLYSLQIDFSSGKMFGSLCHPDTLQPLLHWNCTQVWKVAGSESVCNFNAFSSRGGSQIIFNKINLFDLTRHLTTTLHLAGFDVVNTDWHPALCPLVKPTFYKNMTWTSAKILYNSRSKTVNCRIGLKMQRRHKRWEVMMTGKQYLVVDLTVLIKL